jgi:mannan endo-1,4-beta-mannosidase
MGKRDMHAIMVMNDFWTWSGGMAQYVNWSTGKPIPDPVKTGDWNGFMAYSAGFYRDSLANSMYRKYLSYVIGRTNSITGVPYKDDPTIMAWELANEPRPNPNSIRDTTLLPYFYNWVNTTAEFIHKLAPNQLVTTGSEGSAGTLLKNDIFVREQQPASIDYLTIHIWPKNWSWYKADSASVMFEPTVKKTFSYLDEHIAIAKKLNKPLVLEEFGLPRDNENYDPSSPTTYRDKYYGLVFDTLVTKALNGSPLVGANFWAWGGEGRAHAPDYMWRAGTDFTGDPPQEPQGLNSVFNTDTATLDTIRKEAKMLK